MSGDEIDEIPLGEPRDGTVVREEGNPTPYFIYRGYRYAIGVPEIFSGLGLRNEDVRIVPDGGLAQLTESPDPEQFFLRFLNHEPGRRAGPQ